MSKSVKALMQRATDLALIAGITSDELVTITVSRHYINFHLKPLALARVFRSTGLPKSKLTVKTYREGDVHIDFDWRGAQWGTCVLAKERNSATWQDLLEQQRPLLEPAAGVKALTYAG